TLIHSVENLAAASHSVVSFLSGYRDAAQPRAALPAASNQPQPAVPLTGYFTSSLLSLARADSQSSLSGAPVSIANPIRLTPYPRSPRARARSSTPPGYLILKLT